MNYHVFILSVMLLIGVFSFNRTPNEQDHMPVLHRITTKTAEDVKDFFSYSQDRLPIVSAHRGGPGKGFPENCLETFEHTLSRTHALLEIDPRYTKDGQIVLMHDPTLERTSNGKGKVSDFTLEELQKLRLKDPHGMLTEYKIPTLDQALQWAKGKTILVIDAKDVPIDVRVKKILENKAEANAIVIAYSMEDIQTAYSLSKNMVMEVMVGKMSQVKAIDESGIPWRNVVAFVSHDLPQNLALYAAVHERGAMAIQGSSRNYDKQFISKQLSRKALHASYRELIANGADIIESDLGIETGEALNPLRNEKSSKTKYFK